MKTKKYENRLIGKHLVERKSYIYANHPPDISKHTHVVTFGHSFTLELDDRDLDRLIHMLEQMRRGS